MKPHAYYNEIDPYAALWIENLILEGVIAYGDVDRRSIEDVRPSDLAGFTQCHFFAGLGGWSYALRLAGWPDERPVWTGSCPCQPFSAAGKGSGFADERHLWPSWQWLIDCCSPSTIFGEQVASPAGLAWLDLISADLEGQGYAAWAADLCAAGVGAPHIRQRLYWVGHSRLSQTTRQRPHGGEVVPKHVAERTRLSGGSIERLADAYGRNASAEGLQRSGQHGQQPQDGGACERVAHSSSSTGLEIGSEQQARGQRPAAERGSTTGELGNSSGAGGRRDAGTISSPESGAQRSLRSELDEPLASSWARCEWVQCRDGKARPVEPGTFPLAHGVPARVGRLRAYGNAIVPQVAAEFVRAYVETLC